ncbi:MAG TPA: FAD-binding and (Fe-S)-binding domain-containing protein [Anaeromyxobacter sp.]
MAHARDVRSLPPAYSRFHDALARLIPGDRLHADPLRTFAYGTDASFYRLVPKLVVQVRDEDEVRAVLAAAHGERVPVTFRAAGTSLSGQAVTDHVLVVLAGGWRAATIEGAGDRITLGPGVIGAEANALLAPHGRKIGPDPASIGACMIGGIAANNASGMCCGTAQNSYRTVESMRIVLADGTLLDTSDAESRRRFAAIRPDVLRELAAIRDEIGDDPALAERIRSKYRIKNTTGYSLNAFVDFDDPIDILLHLMIGSEGTLGFMSELTYRTVAELPHKASALVAFPDVESAALATMRLRDGSVSSAELMDRASLRAVERRPGLPSWLATLGPEACALLVEVRAADPATLAARVADATALLREVRTLLPVVFTDRREETERLWDVRRGLFPAVGAARRIGTTVVIEDVAFQLEDLAPATVELQRLMRRHRYSEGIIFGHALDGNLHFVFTQDFGTPAEVERYARFMDEVCFLVAQKYEGSLKGEHGTGRNVAPFVELEWGPKAYALMRRVKRALDPDGLLNPGVLMNDDARAHVRDLKPLPAAHELVDRCTECGFCEPRCPSRGLSLSPRQRIATRRELARLTATGAEPARRARLEEDYRYLGEETCATDGLCATACPVGIDTGELTKRLRADGRGESARGVARQVAGRYAGATAAVRAGLCAADAARAVVGATAVAAVSRGLHALSGGRLPVWNVAAPRAAARAAFADVAPERERKLVYFPSCVVRAMGPAAGDPDARALFEATLSLLDKADYGVLFPAGLDRLCCGLTFDSKGFPELGDEKARELERELLLRSQDGALPVLCDTSPCLARMRKTLDPRLRLYEPAELIHDLLLERLAFVQREDTVALHVPCSATKLGLGPKLRAVAEACAERVVVPAGVGCCGFAGDRGFTHPELNASALAGLRAALPAGCTRGYSTSRTCEIGLSLHGGIPYQSIVYLVDRCTARRGRGAELAPSQAAAGRG